MLTLIFIAVVVAIVLVSRVALNAARTDWGSGLLRYLDGANRLLCCHVHGLEETRLELPREGGVIVVSNHVSGLDPLLLLAASQRPLRFLIAQSEYDRWWLQWLLRRIQCIPVKRRGRADKALYPALNALARGEVLAIFPQGGIVPTGSAPKKLKRGAVFLADRARVPIIPLRIEGVAAEGRTIGAVFVPSRVQIYLGETLGAQMASDARLQALEDFITAPHTDSPKSRHT